MTAAVKEKQCTRCEDWWPADTEFFRRQAKPGSPNRLAPWCRACEADYQTEKRAPEPAPAARVNSVWSLT
jgi:hypothetical protein